MLLSVFSIFNSKLNLFPKSLNLFSNSISIFDIEISNPLIQPSAKYAPHNHPNSLSRVIVNPS